MKPAANHAETLEYAGPDDASLGIARQHADDNPSFDVAVLTDGNSVMASCTATNTRSIAIPEPPEENTAGKELARRAGFELLCRKGCAATDIR